MSVINQRAAWDNWPPHKRKNESRGKAIRQGTKPFQDPAKIAAQRLLMNFFPNFREAFPVHAQIPFAKITKGSDPDLIAGFPQPLSQGADAAVSGGRRRGFAAEVSEGMEHDISESPLIGEPFHMLDGLAENGALSFLDVVGTLTMNENDDAFRCFLIDVHVGRFQNRLRMSFPAKTLGLEAQKFHGSSDQ